jgi:hypothetical protein
VAEIKERREPGDEPAVKTDAEKLGEMKSKLGIEKALYHGIEVEGSQFHRLDCRLKTSFRFRDLCCPIASKYPGFNPGEQ